MLRYAIALAGLLALTSADAVAQTSSGEIKYLAGGIGLDEREQMAAAEKDYNLKLEMATTGGFYVAGAHVIIWDKAGNMVLEATPDGPLMLVDLPAGTYTVNIIYQDQEKKQNVTLDGKARKKLVFTWNSGEER